MDQEKALAEALNSSSIIADWAAQTIVSIPFEPKIQNVKAIAEALSIFKDISSALYEKRPDLKPDYLKVENSNDPGRVVYGPDNPMPLNLQKCLEITGAINMLKSFQAIGKSQTLVEVADREIPKLQELLEKTYNEEI
jgi:hypothetical protein